MANELDGAKLTLHFQMANIAATTATVLQMPSGGNTGLIVPAGYTAHALMLAAHSNADLTAGTATFAITDNGTAIANGPVAELSDTIQAAAAIEPRGTNPIAAGHKLGVTVTTDAAYAPVTADVDAIVYVELWPA